HKIMPIFRYSEEPDGYYAYLMEGDHADDANDGLTPATAIRSLNRLLEILNGYTGALQRRAIIAKKVLAESVTTTRTGGRTIEFISLSNTVIDGLNNLGISDDLFIGFHIKNTRSFFQTISNNVVFNAKDCIIENFIASFSYFIWYVFDNCLVFNVQQYLAPTVASTGLGYQFTNCVVYNFICPSTNGLGATHPYNLKIILKNTIIFDSPNLNIPTNNNFPHEIDYCCIRGAINYKGTQMTHEELQVVGMNLNGISDDPHLNDLAFKQPTVKSYSPCLFRGALGAHIGVGEGVEISASIIMASAITSVNFKAEYGRLVRIDEFDDAMVETAPIDVGGIIILDKVDLGGFYGFSEGEFYNGLTINMSVFNPYDSARIYHKGSAVTHVSIKYKSLENNNNDNTPASSPTQWERLTWDAVSYDAGKIVQYTDDKWYKANTTTSTSWVAGEWDEIILHDNFDVAIKAGRTVEECVAAEWAYLPLSQKSYIDDAGKGNADDNFDVSTSKALVFRFVKFLIHAKTLM
ncbi:MAG: hypothetical protein GX154_11730, partial [Clostridiales bacterium]|nr:hypothetical protein [Clostridiales bacterium]